MPLVRHGALFQGGASPLELSTTARISGSGGTSVVTAAATRVGRVSGSGGVQNQVQKDVSTTVVVSGQGHISVLTTLRRPIIERIALVVPIRGRQPVVERIAVVTVLPPRRPVVERIAVVTPVRDRKGQLGQFILRFPSPDSGSGGGIPDTPDTPGGIDPVTGEEILIQFNRVLGFGPPLLRASDFLLPRGHQSFAHSGEGQFRASFSAGRSWEEEYAPVRSSDPRHRRFRAYLGDLSQNERLFEIDYPEYNSVTLGTIAGVATVSGGGQTGAVLTSAGWTGTLLTGDIIRVAGLNYTMDVIADVDSGTSFDIPINPPIRVGASPADGAVINYGAAVRYRVKIDEVKAGPESGPDDIMIGFTVVYREVP